MTDFVKTIYVYENFSPQFIFQFLHTTAAIKRYRVWVSNNGSQLAFFEIEQKSYGSWKIIDAPKAPWWIMQMEQQVSDVIIEALKDQHDG